MYDCTAATTTVRPGAAAASAATQPSSLYLLGPAVFDPTDDDALSCPLIINAAEGQHINLTLYDFGVPLRREHVADDYSGYDQVQRAVSSLYNVTAVSRARPVMKLPASITFNDHLLPALRIVRQ